jgi:hypothetical protein
MIIQTGGNSYNLTPICGNAIGIFLLVGYIGFAHLVTHSGDFYHIRRWKASLWFAGIFGVILYAFFIIFSIPTTLGSVERITFQAIGQAIGVIISGFTIIIPVLFVSAIGTHHQLRLWLNSDDYLDKIWKDPNKGHKNPIQEI